MRKGLWIAIFSILASLPAGAAQALWSDGMQVGSVPPSDAGAVAKRVEAVHKIPVKSELTSATDIVLDEVGAVARRPELVHNKPRSELAA